ncbi:MAG: hypothetical protein IJS38_03095 [Erysipelotrichaceae bacterium]|nr:hypothetical protein [Erysipelotrichaceae bacterium]
MIKRFIFYLTVSALLVVGTYRFYKSYQPKEAEVVKETIQFRISPLFYEQSIDDYIMTADGSVCILFYQEDSLNSLYVFDTILARILEQYNLKSLDNLVYCNLTEISDASITYTKNHWGFYTMPAFVNLQYKEGVLTVHSSLEWNSASTLTYAMVENWLINNKIINPSLPNS